MSTNITKQGIVKASEFSEIPYNPYDPAIYTEPDGSTWVRIIHHVPSGGYFSSTDSFSTYVYKDANRWFFGSLCNSVTNGLYEVMIKQKTTSDATEKKFRWIQYTNPMGGTFGDVDAADVVKNTSSGYSTNASYGGIYMKNSNTYLSANNGTSSSWWGAFGSWTSFQGGIPGYNAEVITTGYFDLYLRVSPSTSIYEDSIQAREFIEW